MKFFINKNTIGIIIKNNSVKCYEAGKHYSFNAKNLITLHDYSSYEEQKFFIDKYFCPDNLNNLTETINVDEGTFMIRYVNNIRKGVYKSGTHHFLITDNDVRYDFFNKDQIEITGLSLDTVRVLAHEKLVTFNIVSSNNKGVLYVDGTRTKILTPGAYILNTSNNEVYVRQYNMAVNTLSPQNQELLTKDKVTIRINFWVNYKITSLETVLENYEQNLEEILRNNIQMAIRSFISEKTLDEVLIEKDNIGKAILEHIQANESEFGVTFLDAGIKDIILPGEIRDIMNTVLIAEKKAQANVITRREETASTRSLLNTAKLMEENAVLYRLKELEMMERIFEKVGSINVSGSNVLESLEQLMGLKKKN